MNPLDGKTEMSLPSEFLIQELESTITDANRGLPEDVFLFVSRVTPLVNVDLLIRDDRGRTLMTWRNDRYSNPGWHIPGGIIRFKEAARERILATALAELKAEVEFDPAPLAINEIIHPTRDERGHSISLLYRCRLLSCLPAGRRFRPTRPRRDAWKWHDCCPENMVPAQAIYRPFFSA